MPQSCFHCHLPVPAKSNWQYPVFGEQRDFCCAGCHAVCKTIVDNGLGDYYQHRTEAAKPGEQVPDFLREVDLYDHPEIQKTFVQNSGQSKQADLVLEDIRCASCVWLSEKQLRQQPGILAVNADYVSQRVQVRWDPAQTELSEILRALAAIGYMAHPYAADHRESLLRDQKNRNLNRILFAAAIGMPVMQFSLASYFYGFSGAAELPLWVDIGRWVMLLAVTAILLFPGQEFFQGAWRDIRHRRLGMDIPIVIGLSIAWLASFWSTMQKTGEVYFDSIAMFVLFVLVSRRYELTGRRKAAEQLDRLARIIPQQVDKITQNGLQKVPVVELNSGDIIQLKPGETSPADGVLHRGGSEFDESILTGESIPQEKMPGDTVVAGSINISQIVEIQIEQLGEQSSLGTIQQLLRHGQSSKSAQTLLAQRVVSWFVPAILLLALSSLIWWSLHDPSQAISNTVAILIVSCPCALALATPVVSSLAAGRFAQLGIVPIKVAAIETLAQVKTAVFDKTGTLSDGNFQLVNTHTYPEANQQLAQQLALSLETGSSHPLASAFVDLDFPLLKLGDYQQTQGAGVMATYANAHWRLGKPDFALPNTALSRAQQQQIEQYQQQGQHCLLLSRNAQPYALFVLQDQMRDGAYALFDALPELGVQQTALISGDQPASVKQMQQRLHIQQAQANLTATDKLHWIGQFKQTNQPILMLGDGINDAPTLAAADVSISFAQASKLAQYHSDFLLLGQSLEPVTQAIKLSQRMRSLIKQNYAWAIGYNLIAIPLAFSGYIPPWGAALGMSLSSIVVVFNSMRLTKSSK